MAGGKDFGEVAGDAGVGSGAARGTAVLEVESVADAQGGEEVADTVVESPGGTAGLDDAVKRAIEAGEGLGESFGSVGKALVKLHVTGPGIQDSQGCILLMSIQTDVVHDAVSLR
jgi:hypothetical protein